MKKQQLYKLSPSCLAHILGCQPVAEKQRERLASDVLVPPLLIVSTTEPMQPPMRGLLRTGASPEAAPGNHGHSSRGKHTDKLSGCPQVEHLFQRTEAISLPWGGPVRLIIP